MKKIIVTTSWDDGVEALDLKLANLLKKYELKGTFYFSKKLKFKNKNSVFREIKDEEIKEISTTQEIGAHTLNHFNLKEINEFSAREEIGNSKRWLEKLIKKPIKMFSFPYGATDERIVKMVKENGFIGARTTEVFKTNIENSFLMGTTLHFLSFFPRNKECKFIEKLKIFRQRIIGNYKAIQKFKLPVNSLFGLNVLAENIFNQTLKEGGVFHIWGHAWEIEKYNLWDDLEKIFKLISKHKNILYLSNSEAIEASAKQVNTTNESEYSFKNYDSLKTFNGYFYQIETIIKSGAKSVLEIGMGNGTVSQYLKKQEINITTCDIDVDLCPDVVGDIRNLPFDNNSFDAVLACQILEHIPFSDFKKALLELRRVSRGTVVVSLPYSHNYLEFFTKIVLPFWERQINFSVSLPFARKKLINKKEHYWEMGLKGHSRSVILKLLKSLFSIKAEFGPILNKNRWFFILEK